MNIKKIEDILKRFASNTIGFKVVALVNFEGLPIYKIGIDENTASTNAGKMLYVDKLIREEFKWQVIEQIQIKGTEGYIILTACTPNFYLLVKFDDVPQGMLLGDLNPTVQKLKAVLEEEESENDQVISPSRSSDPKQDPPPFWNR
ncbi:MAG: roadblock/LC7 domain-containing protein [Gloeotrichia echinulata GP01]